MPNRDLTNMRNSYEKGFLLEKDCDKNPFIQFEKWFQQAIDDNLYEPNAMQIATVGKDLQPSVRTVLLKSFDKNGFIFYTNYDSKKGSQIKENDKVALLFWFREHERQVRIEGIATQTTTEMNEIYFRSRPRDSQIAAFVSKQSSTIEDRKTLDELFIKTNQEFKNVEIPIKRNWGGYNIKPTLIEFWQGRQNRLHDRLQYTLKDNQIWILERLAP
ncbi:MAG TPA: pyridoxamine 5'-phosphate oxidase [Chitinophagales bacterium]|nr:pyridoxamine 5'-phosphate oxidase [Chitinophagales bacterium]